MSKSTALCVLVFEPITRVVVARFLACKQRLPARAAYLLRWSGSQSFFGRIKPVTGSYRPFEGGLADLLTVGQSRRHSVLYVCRLKDLEETGKIETVPAEVDEEGPIRFRVTVARLKRVLADPTWQTLEDVLERLSDEGIAIAST